MHAVRAHAGGNRGGQDAQCCQSVGTSGLCRYAGNRKGSRPRDLERIRTGRIGLLAWRRLAARSLLRGTLRQGEIVMSEIPNVRVIRAPRGPKLSCRNWSSEAAMRMLMNNLDPE